MGARGYVSNRYPSLSIGNRIQFRGGLFVTEDPDLQAQIEANEWFGVHIHPRETQEEIAAAEAAETAAPEVLDAVDTPEPEREQPKVRQGRRGSK